MFIFQCPIFLPFHSALRVLKARILKQFAVPSPGDPTMTCPSWVALHSMAQSFILYIYVCVYVCVCVCVYVFIHFWASLVAQTVESACSVRGLVLVLGLGRSPGGGHSNLLQYSCLENPHGQRSLVGYSPWGHRVRHD